MKRIFKILGKTIKVLGFILLGIVLLLTGFIFLLYSPRIQDTIRTELLTRLNKEPGIEARLDTLDIRFPLDVKLAGLMLASDGDTLVAARKAQLEIKPWSLLYGTAEVSRASLCDAFYKMGNADSLMEMTIRARELELRPASVGLASMAINIENGSINDGCVDMTIRPDTTTTTAAPASEPTDMTIDLGRLSLRNFTYKLHLLPSIDSLGTNIKEAVLAHGRIDMKAQTIGLRTFTGTGLDAKYITPDSATIASVPVVPESTSASAPWTVEIDSIRFDRSSGLYTTQGVAPLPGLDFAYIQADSMTLAVSHFYNQATTISLPLTLSATERCGVRLDAKGTFAMDSTGMYFRRFEVSTPAGTDLNADGMLGIGDMTTDPSLPMKLAASGDISVADLRKMFPAFIPYLAGFSNSQTAALKVDTEGTPSRLNIADLQFGLNRCVSLSGSGYIANIFSPDNFGGNIDMRGQIFDVKSIVDAVMEPGSGIRIPPMTLRARMLMNPVEMTATLDARTLDGKLALDADYLRHSDGYSLEMTATDFPVEAFMPDLGVGKVTMQASASGKGFDFFKPETSLTASANVKSAVYNKYDYQGIDLDANLNGGMADVNLGSNTTNLNFNLKANGNLTGNEYDWDYSLDGRHIDLHALNLMANPAVLTTKMSGNAKIAADMHSLSADLYIPQLYLKEDVGDIDITDIKAVFSANDTLSHLVIDNRDLHANAFVYGPLDSLGAKFANASTIIDSQIARRKVNFDEIQRALPGFDIDIKGGHDNLINDILSESRMGLRAIDLSASNDSVLGLAGHIYEFNTGSARLDTISMNIDQAGDKLRLLAKVDNRPGNLDEWAHVRADALINTDRLGLRLSQQNNLGKTGFDIGAIAMLSDSVVNARLFPLQPTIGYKKWQVNLNNFISYNFYTRHIDANLRMKGENSALDLYTEHNALHAHTDSIDHGQEDIILKISDIHIQDWIAINPFAPPMRGDLSANMRINWDGATNINGSGTVGLDNFFYDNQRVATLLADVDVSTNTSGTVRASADLMVDGKKSITLAGALNDSTTTSPFNLDLSVIHFPLATVNPFLPADMMRLRGTLNGSMQVSGNSDHPLLNGNIDFDSTAVKVAMTGTEYTFSDVDIPVVDNVVTFNNFAISGVNENPLTINGRVDMSDMTSPKLDLKFDANNMMVVNTTRAARGADIYGKAYLGLDARVKGSTRLLNIDADVTVMSGTNVTYVMTEEASEITSRQQSDMVKFVNFNDTTAVIAADSIAQAEMLLNIDALLTIQNGTTINVDLPTSARDKVQIIPNGSVQYTQTPVSDGRVTGRINIDGGFARYTIPVIGSEKEFKFNNGSYVAFNGDMFNPVLNIHATDVVKANVTQQGQNSRLVNFDIMLGVTGTLARMDVKFDLATNDDITIANELQSMSAEQRANQAMNMLLYNMYTGPGTKGNANLSANPLFSFLTSQINNWAANNIKGVDLQFGIDKYDRTVDGASSTTMSYSYQVSKSLFNDRFRVVVGGNYTTDANADENFSQNLINDISFEYYLNKQQTMLVKLFRHTGYESILEGEVTQTGVGFVYKRRLQRLSQMLPKFMRPKRKKKTTEDMPADKPELRATETSANSKTEQE